MGPVRRVPAPGLLQACSLSSLPRPLPGTADVRGGGRGLRVNLQWATKHKQRTQNAEAPREGAVWGGRIAASPCSFTPAAWAGAASTQVAPEQAGGSCLLEREQRGLALPRPAVTAPEQTWVIEMRGPGRAPRKRYLQIGGVGLGPGCGPCSREGVGWGFLEKHRRTTLPEGQHKGTPSLTPSGADACPEPGCGAVHCQESKGLTRERVKPRPDG